MAASSFKDRALGLLNEANRRHVIVEKDGKSYVNLPLLVVVIGGLLAPWLLVVGVIVALALSCSMRIDVESEAVEVAEQPAGDVASAAASVPETAEDLADRAGEAVEELASSAEAAVEGTAAKDAEP